MNMRDIEAFVALAEAGSVNRAALRLNLTQPAVSRRIQGFETAMGDVALLDRGAKPAVLTPAGQRALVGCRQVLKALAELQAISPDGSVTEFRLGVAHGLTTLALSTPLDSAQRHFPHIRPRVTSDWTVHLITQLADGALDCVVGLITERHTLPAGVEQVPIGNEPIVVVANINTPITGVTGQRLRISDLAGQGWILNPRGCGYRDALVHAFDRASKPLRIVGEIFGHDLQLSLIARGGGLGLVPRSQLVGSPYRRQLKIVKVDDFDLRATISIIQRDPHRALTPIIEHFQTTIQEALAAMPKTA